jgi:hypothetical protein
VVGGSSSFISSKKCVVHRIELYGSREKDVCFGSLSSCLILLHSVLMGFRIHRHWTCSNKQCAYVRPDEMMTLIYLFKRVEDAFFKKREREMIIS